VRAAAGSALFAALGVFAAIEGRALGLTDLGSPGPGLFPFLFGVLLAATAGLSLCVDLVRVRRAADPRHARRQMPATDGLGEDRRDDRAPGGGARVLGYVAIAAAMTASMGWTGFVPAAFAGLLAMVRGIERMPWRTALLTAGGAAVAADLLFVRLLKVPLPPIPL
jgi:putative tricarboxylic transport membrane protein